MAQTGYTPILIYSSTTASQAPSASNLTNSTLGSELAINITDGKLFYKDNGGSVQVIGWKTVPTTAGGTGLTSYTAGDLLYYATGTTLSKLGIGTAYYMLGVNAGATAPSWQPSATSVLTTQGDLLYASAANTLARLAKNTTASRYLSNSGTSNNPSWAQIDLTNGVTGTLPVGNGGTGITSLGTGVATWLGTPSSANLAAAVTDETGSGSLVFGTNPTFSNSGSGNPSANFTNSAFQDVSVNLFNASSTVGNKITLQFASNGGATLTNSIVSYGSSYGGGLDNAIQFGNSSGAIRVTTAGDVAVTTGNIIPGTAAKGINFTANTPASGMTSQLLNWYEEGTWTAAFVAQTGSITMDNSYKTGYYTRVGRLVTVGLHARFSAVSSPSGGLTVTGLPFTSNSNTQCRNALAIAPVAIGTTAKPMMAYISSNTTSITIAGFDAASGGYVGAAGYITATSEIYITGSYYI
jgi:hypothetical protein